MSIGGAVVRLTRRCTGLCKCCGEIKDFRSQLTEARERLRELEEKCIYGCTDLGQMECQTQIESLNKKLKIAVGVIRECNMPNLVLTKPDQELEYIKKITSRAIAQIQEPNGKKGGL